uniref:Uncharacterized protein n=1 Tax=Siphoviridae sp. ctB3v5 TaxID=2826186 RepID=A0A8S5M8M7_9CAUD|nr:MAG TPA: hypothetical protein [Siphoviridae sp. ctB3v5]
MGKHSLNQKRLIFIQLIVLYMVIGIFLIKNFLLLWSLLKMKKVEILLK